MIFVYCLFIAYLLILCESLHSLCFIADGVCALDIPHPALSYYEIVGNDFVVEGYADGANDRRGYAKEKYYAS